MLYRINLETTAKVEFQDITQNIKEILSHNRVEHGTCHVFVPHTTAGITINEHADPSVVKDITDHLDIMIPQHRKYSHSEGNSPAHIKATIMGNSQVLLVENGKLVLGTWQGVFFCEFDGPRNRSVIIKTIPDIM
ncbi:secondary thiamine-phosphate synthase enzyme YjbQ [Chloroflexota bacterium]